MPSAVIKIAIAWIVFNALNERVYETTKGDFVHCERLLRAGPALEGTACGEGKWCRYTFYVVSYYIHWVKTSWTYSRSNITPVFIVEEG